MAEPVDFYSDIASVNVTPNGVTLMFLRSMPIPVGGRIDATARSADEDGDEKAEEAAISVELVARARMSHRFTRELRDLLTRTLEQWESQQAPQPVSSSAEKS